ncbi:sulfotransferase 1C2-like [Glandiceps talaboti]
MAVTRENPAWQKKCMHNPMFDPKGKLQTMEIRPDDLFLITYPKSGTHWLKFLVRAMLNNGNYEEVPDETRVAFIEIAFAEEGDEPSLVISKKHPDNDVDIPSMKSPRLLGSHFASDLLPTQINTKNPKSDKLVAQQSSRISRRYAHTKNFSYRQRRSILERENKIQTLHQYNTEKIEDFKSVIQKLAQFIGKNLSMGELDKLADLCSIEKMRHNPVANDAATCALLGITGNLDKAEGTPFAGKGKVGGWKNYFTVAQNELFDKSYTEWMKGTGLDFDFE